MKKSKCGCKHSKVKVDIPTKKVSTPNPRLKVSNNNAFRGNIA